ncbi:microtubule-associated protein futsch [Nematostella vectensis]|uniref:microtubule-associated protein futsch n=1 Tax=Nematostella vectensis TaxID=45351 RepID=UPI002076FE07|nr:microtubule-associated protein futsch [Nematostella vectensis]
MKSVSGRKLAPKSLAPKPVASRPNPVPSPSDADQRRLRKLKVFLKSVSYNGSEGMKFETLNDLYCDHLLIDRPPCTDLPSLPEFKCNPTPFVVASCFNRTQVTKSARNSRRAPYPRNTHRRPPASRKQTSSANQNTTPTKSTNIVLRPHPGHAEGVRPRPLELTCTQGSHQKSKVTCTQGSYNKSTDSNEALGRKVCLTTEFSSKDITMIKPKLPVDVAPAKVSSKPQPVDEVRDARNARERDAASNTASHREKTITDESGASRSPLATRDESTSRPREEDAVKHSATVIEDAVKHSSTVIEDAVKHSATVIEDAVKHSATVVGDAVKRSATVIERPPKGKTSNPLVNKTCEQHEAKLQDVKATEEKMIESKNIGATCNSEEMSKANKSPACDSSEKDEQELNVATRQDKAIRAQGNGEYSKETELQNASARRVNGPTESEKSRADHVSKPAEAEKSRADHVSKPAEAETSRADHVSKPVEAEKSRADHVSKPAEAEKSRADHVSKPAEAEKSRADHVSKPAEAEKSRADHVSKPDEAEKSRADHVSKPAEPKKSRADHVSKSAEAEKSCADHLSKPAEPEKSRASQAKTPPKSERTGDDYVNIRSKPKMAIAQHVDKLDANLMCSLTNTSSPETRQQNADKITNQSKADNKRSKIEKLSDKINPGGTASAVRYSGGTDQSTEVRLCQSRIAQDAQRSSFSRGPSERDAVNAVKSGNETEHSSITLTRDGHEDETCGVVIGGPVPLTRGVAEGRGHDKKWVKGEGRCVAESNEGSGHASEHEKASSLSQEKGRTKKTGREKSERVETNPEETRRGERSRKGTDKGVKNKSDKAGEGQDKPTDAVRGESRDPPRRVTRSRATRNVGGRVTKIRPRRRR